MLKGVQHNANVIHTLWTVTNMLTSRELTQTMNISMILMIYLKKQDSHLNPS